MAEDWARGTIKETPFWRDGMSVEEYEEERNYLMEHWQELRQGTYTPLWKQREKYSERFCYGKFTKVCRM